MVSTALTADGQFRSPPSSSSSVRWKMLGNITDIGWVTVSSNGFLVKSSPVYVPTGIGLPKTNQTISTSL